MNNYFIVWTYIANYGVIQNYPADTALEAANKVVAGFSKDFAEKGKVYVFDSPPCAFVQGKKAA